MAACLAIEGFPGSARAESEETVAVDEVVIGASRMPLPLSRGAAAVTVLERSLSRQYADDLNRQSIGGFIVLDASLRRRLFRGAEFFLNGEHLTERRSIAAQTGSLKTLGPPLLVPAGARID